MPEPLAAKPVRLRLYRPRAGDRDGLAFSRYARKVQIDTGRILPKGLVAVGLIFGLPLMAFAVAGFPLTFDMPKQSRFNLTGGMQVYPEFVALLLGL